MRKQQLILTKPQKTSINSVTLILFAFATAFFPRIIVSKGPLSIINFFHLFIVPVIMLIVIAKTRTRDKKKINVSWLIIYGILTFLGVIIASSLLNSAGLINAFLSFFLLMEPFILLVGVICIPISPEFLKRLRKWILIFSLINLVLAYIQYPLLVAGILSTGGMGIGDAIQGVFYLTGAGNYVSASVSISAGLYYFTSEKKAPKWMRIAVLIICFGQLLISDSKQIILAMIVAWILLAISNSTDSSQLLKYLIGLILFCLTLFWCVQNIEYFSAFKSWARPELYGADGDGTLAKFAGVRIITSHYKSPLNWLLGLGPGHTIGRLGGWIIRDYHSLLSPLGATTHPASSATWIAVSSNWINSSGGSTMFSPFFGWAGIWGDLGFLGLGIYLYMSYIVWKYVCVNDLSKYLLLNILIVGLIFTQMEEPGYMLSIAMFVGLQWHEHRCHIQRR
jgi:hypothetical protein